MKWKTSMNPSHLPGSLADFFSFMWSHCVVLWSPRCPRIILASPGLAFANGVCQRKDMLFHKSDVSCQFEIIPGVYQKYFWVRAYSLVDLFNDGGRGAMVDAVCGLGDLSLRCEWQTLDIWCLTLHGLLENAAVDLRLIQWVNKFRVCNAWTSRSTASFSYAA